jgi:hypothetical protein
MLIVHQFVVPKVQADEERIAREEGQLPPEKRKETHRLGWEQGLGAMWGRDKEEVKEHSQFFAWASGLVQPTENDASLPVPGLFFGVSISRGRKWGETKMAKGEYKSPLVSSCGGPNFFRGRASANGSSEYPIWYPAENKNQRGVLETAKPFSFETVTCFFDGFCGLTTWSKDRLTRFGSSEGTNLDHQQQKHLVAFYLV